MNFIQLKSGQSVEGDEIKAYRSEAKAQRYIYLMAGVHGDEVEGMFVCAQIFDWLKEEDLQLPLIVIPILNVDGHRHNTRTNSRGVDLNRNLPSSNWTAQARDTKYSPGTHALSEPENQFLVKLFEKYPPKFILSIHSWIPLINYNGEGCLPAAQILHQHNNYKMVADIEGHPTPGSLGEYGPEKWKAPVLTFECPLLEKKSLKEIWNENESAFKALFHSDFFQNIM